MSWNRWLLCTLLLVVVDGTVLFMLISLLAFLAGLPRAPLSFAACALLLATAVLVSVLRQVLPRRWPRHAWPEAVAGVAAVWLAVASVGPAGVRAGLMWPRTLLVEEGGIRLALVLAALAGAWLWRHGLRRVQGPVGAPAIARGFRAGLVVFVVVLALEAAGGIELGTRAVLVPFFCASLLGMALARAPARGPATRAWLLAVAGSVAGVVAAGLVLAFLAVVLVRGGAERLRTAWIGLAQDAAASVSATLAELFGTGGGTRFDLRGASAEIPEAAVLAVLLAGGAVTAYFANRLLRAPRETLPRIVIDLGEEERDEIPRRDTPTLRVLVDAALPRWLRRRRVPRRVPARDPTDIQSLYLALLQLAHERGIPLDPAHTPYERARHLRRELPGIPVDDITHHYVAARYGNHPPPPETLAALSKEVFKRDAVA